VLISINPAIPASNAAVLLLIVNSVSSSSAFPVSTEPKLPFFVNGQDNIPAQQLCHAA
jgi:hypothetical protein